MLFDSGNDEENIKLYKEGHQEAFKFLVDKYTPILYNYTARLTNKDHAPDILQDIFIKAWKNLDGFDQDKASFKTWIFTITKNTITDFLRKKKSLVFSQLEKYDEEEKSFSDNIEDTELLPDKMLMELEDKESLNKTLDKLRDNYKEILMLHYQEDMTFEEIGEVLNKPPNTVKSQHRRAIIELRENLDKMHQNE